MMMVTALKDPTPIAPPAIDLDAPWYVVLTQPQQEITTVWRLHELGLEMFTPVIRKRVKTGRIGKNGQKVTRIIAKSMFPGYGFLRATATNDPDALIWRERNGTGIRGVREIMRDVRQNPITLPHGAVMAVFRKQSEVHQDWIVSGRSRRFAPFKRGDKVKFDDPGSPYDGIFASVDKIDSRGRVQLLMGMIKHWVPSEKVVAA